MIIPHIHYASNGCYSDDNKSDLSSITKRIHSLFSELDSPTHIDFLFHWKHYLDSPTGDCLGVFLNSSLPWDSPRIIRFTSDIPDKLTLHDGYVVVLSNNLKDMSTPIEKSFTISHEIQHLSQFILSREYFIKCILLHRYFYSLRDSRTSFKLPHDLDAIKRAKEINCHLFGKDAVVDFINHSIPESGNNNEYWTTVRDIHNSYDFRTETIFLWNTYKESILASSDFDTNYKEVFDYCISNKLDLR